ncbi:AAA domain-containing protein [Gracilibacillus massiliensis]|uniref:AAA domain-containing protein n=1 Tax=Gracilibacillus massiliensis TaxID=1564956 RepID=UPI00071C4A67|nr:AAA domain-containing protein [Gracilibacillus massiliensis]
MDIEHNLVLIKNVDKTEQIDFCKNNNEKWDIKYFNNQKVYTYNDKNVIWLRNPNILDPNNNIVYENNLPISGIHTILDFGTYIKVTFNSGFKKTYPASALVIEQTALSNAKENKCFDYLKTLANSVSVKLDGDVSFLRKQYNKLSLISPRSVLSTYLGKKTLINERQKEQQVIYPFGFNASQKMATEKAMTSQISMIEGPPGTGKTQTILNIIANAVINHKTVAIVSNNNSATANVLEKLQKYGIDFIAAYLGNKENKDKFFSEQNGSYPNMSDWILDDTELHSIKSHLRDEQGKLNKMLKKQTRQATLKQELSELKTENAYFEKYYTDTNFLDFEIKSLHRMKADNILQLIVEYEQQAGQGQIRLRNKLYNLFVYGIFNFKIYKKSPDIVISYLQKVYYELKLKELIDEIGVLDSELVNYDFDSAMKAFSKDSMQLFKASLAKRYGTGGKRLTFSSDALWRNFDTFSKEYPVILSTTHSLRNCAANNYLFDYVLIDEASQVDIVTGALALSCAKNAVIVGDDKQLPNVVTEEIKEKSTIIFESYQLDNAYNYAEHSLLSSIENLFDNLPKTLLKEHYRCHPKIISFCNQKFYNDDLVILTDEQIEEKPLILFKTVKGNHARGTMNQRQIDVITKEIIPEQKRLGYHESIGIIAPFRLQADEIQKATGIVDIESDTVHKYQGREKDIIILSTVSNQMNPNDFADNPNLINVAVSRAVKKLIIVVAESSEEWHGTNIGDLIRYIKYNNFEIKDSQIRSVFDLLYSSYTDKLFEVIKKSKKVSAHISENLMNNVIEKVLDDESFQSLDYVLHHPLRMLIKDTEKLTEKERKYAMNILTHTDFVIFNKMDKMPVLVVEVDGHAFHANNPKQLKRDEMKDTILRKYNIPIIRLKTTGSEEEIILRNKLFNEFSA